MFKDSVRFLFIVSTTILLLIGCGGSDDGSAGAAKSSAVAQGEKQSAQKTQKCPPKVTSGVRDASAPVDDIVGLRPGLSFDDAKWILQCRDDVSTIEVGEKWNIKQNFGFPVRQIIRATNGVACTGQEIAKDLGSYNNKKCPAGGNGLKALKDVTQEYRVVFTGMMGEEKAGAAWRKTLYSEGEAPTMEAMFKSLNEKYGEPHITEKGSRGGVYLTWLYDLLGRPTSQSSNDFYSCKNSVAPSFSSSQRWAPNCGLSIRVSVTPMQSNELLVQEMNVGIMHQKNFYDDGQKFEQALAAANERRKQDEAAASQGTTPDL